MTDTDYTAMTDGELDAAEADLAVERTHVRLEQNKVTAEKELRRMLGEMSGSARQALVLRLSGGVSTVGATAAEATPGDAAEGDDK